MYDASKESVHDVIGMVQDRVRICAGLLAIPFQAHHLDDIEIARHQREIVALMSGDLLHATGKMLASGSAYTLIAEDRIVGCGGIFPWSQWRGQAWAFVAPGFGAWRERMTPFAVAVLDARQASGMHRIEAVVSLVPLYPRRFAERLGFASPRLMDAYNADGTDAIMYARIR